MRDSLIFAIVSILLFSSCSVSKMLNNGEVLYTGTNLSFSKKKDINKAGELKSALESKIYPKPNTKFLGLFYTRIWFYQKVKPKADKEKSFKHWLKYKVGQKPILISDFNTETIEVVLNKTMQDYGYFNCNTEIDIESKKQKAQMNIVVKNNKQTSIRAIDYAETIQVLDTLGKQFKKLEIKAGMPYNLAKIEMDRTTLATEIRSLGYYDFDKNDIYYVVDTSVNENEVDIYVKIKTPKNDSIHRKFYISNVNVFPSFTASDTSGNLKKYSYKNHFTVFEDFKYVGKKTLYNNILIQNNTLFSVKDYNYTVERLNSLGIFQFIDVTYKKNGSDSLDVDIKMTSGKSQGVKFDISANTSNRSFLGSELSVSYFNKNLLKGAENLTVKASSGIEFQFVNNEAKVNILEVNFEARLGLPRLLIPFRKRQIQSGTPPQTFFSIEESYQQWLQYYTLNSLKFSFGYDWLSNKNHRHKLTPLFINFLSLLNTTDEFDAILDANSDLKTSFENNITLGSGYNFTFNTQKNEDDKNYFYFSGFIETAGNLSFALARAIKPKQQLPYKILDIPFAQFTKVELDLRHYLKLSKNVMLASRINTGVGVAYGNSNNLPYSRQFFLGGPNTVRAFSFRSLGPGSYSSENTEDSNPIEQSGDLKLLLNTELRFPLYKFLKGAFFLDAGNVWLLKDDENRPGGQFKINSFAEQLALGTGLGIRLDFTYIVVRSDFGIPLYKPYAKPEHRWITNFPEQGYSQWQKKNFVWNIAIGYPF